MTTVGWPTQAPTFVGRADELTQLEQLIHQGEHAVVYVHGIPGIGKSSLVRRLLEQLRAAEHAVVQLDCRTVEPTERGLLSALGTDSLETFVERLDTTPPVIALDHFEVFRLMDTWLRQVLVPVLPDGARLLLASREQPVAAWFSVGGFRSVPLGPMSSEDAAALLARFDVGASEAQRINRIAHGHPLALTLAGAGILEQPQRELEEAATGPVIDALARLYLEDVDDPLARKALEASSVVRRTTEPLLGAMLEGDDAADALERLLQLPFVEAGRDGLVVHEAVRSAIGGFLRGANPVRHRGYRRAAWHELREEVRDAAPSELWRYTADMLYLIENPVVREAFFPSDAQPLAVEPARPDDGAAIVAIAERHEPPSAAAMLAAWWDEAPDTFSAVRDRDSVVTGFFSLLENEHFLKAMDDPIVDQWSSHLRDNPVPKGQRVLGLRRWLDTAKGEQPCAVQAASWLDVKRTYMEMRPALRRIYVVVNDVPTYWPVVEKLGFRPISEHGVELDGVTYTSVVLDFGPGSVDGWLAGLVGAELGIGEEAPGDDSARELVVRGERVSLTPLEFGLFNHLRQCEGKAVSRQELLREVWGTDYAGGSNVVDAVVRSLRGKLGDAASVLETVRGSGYRLRADWRADL